MSETFIIVKFNIEGTHRWPNAPDKYAILRNRHGHIFRFEVQIPITTSRQIEFLEARRRLMRAIKDSYGHESCDFGGMSCEDLARIVITHVSGIYGCGAIARVFEDEFVGAEVRSGRLRILDS